MADETQGQSIQARIAALNLGHVGRAPVMANEAKSDVALRPSLDERSQSTGGVPENALERASGIGNEPAGPRRNGVLPPPTSIVRTGAKEADNRSSKPAAPPPPRLPLRKPSTQVSPALPPRRPSDQLARKISSESVSSTISSTSAFSAYSNAAIKDQHSRALSNDTGNRIRAPVYNPNSLPPLPPKRPKDGKRCDAEKSPAVGAYKDAERVRPVPRTRLSVDRVDANPPSVPTLPPRRPSGPESSAPERSLPPSSDRAPPRAIKSALAFGLNKASQEPQVNGANPSISGLSGAEELKNRDQNHTTTVAAAAIAKKTPPVVPLSSRPDLSKLLASKPKLSNPASIQSNQSPVTSSCLLCRDFTAPDHHAVKFPRQSVPSLDWLAVQLTSPFAESPTDQARCIFTWLHHNIAYDTVSFFNNNVQPSTPASTLASGLAVCEGYAGLFTAIATKAGLESMVVGGHGKGYSFSALKPGDPVPAEYSTHAWNAVKIDGGEWKLVDACWGAGHVNGKNQPYTKHFSPRMFSMPNDEFGLRHFPTNRAHFFRSDGRQVSWEDYILGDARTLGDEPVRIYSGVAEREGLAERSLTPRGLHITVSPTASASVSTHFSFSRVCPHWSGVRNGQGPEYVFILSIHGLDGRADDYLAFDTDGHGAWWLDVETRILGAPGQHVSCYAVESVGGESGRGLGVDGYRHAKGRKGMGFGGVAAWELV